MKRKNRIIFERYERNLSTAYFQDWSRNMGTEDLTRLREAYLDETGIDYPGSIGGCASCQLRFLKTVARWWFSEKDKLSGNTSEK